MTIITNHGLKQDSVNMYSPQKWNPQKMGYIYLRVKQWLLELEGMGELLKDLEEVV